jgi:hypothetical protein
VPHEQWRTAGDPGPKTIGTKTPVSHGRITVELTATTVRSAYLLRPSRRLSEITIGVLARAQKASDAQVHAFCYLSTHMLNEAASRQFGIRNRRAALWQVPGGSGWRQASGVIAGSSLALRVPMRALVQGRILPWAF